MMRRFLAVLLLLIIFSAGCGETDEEYITPDEQAKILSTQIFECFLHEQSEQGQ